MSSDDGLVQTANIFEGLRETDIAPLVRALSDTSRRVQRIDLSAGSVWIKRYGTEKATIWLKIHAFAARFLPLGVLTPSPLLSPEGMVDREIRRIEQFGAKGFPTPRVLYRSAQTLVLSDSGPAVTARLKALRSIDPQAHEALLVRCARDLGRLHQAGLCHGRPHPRDFTVSGDRIGFLDFEEEPDAVMPLADAQGRDMWLLCLALGSLSLTPQQTLRAAYAAWSSAAPNEAVARLAHLTRILRPLLPLARALGRVRASADIRRFITTMTLLGHPDS